MPISIITVTTVSCDGSETDPCKENASVTFDASQSIALRLARKAGWKIDGSVMCMECHYAAVKARGFPVTSSMAVVPQRGGSLMNQPVQKARVDLAVPVTVCEPLVQLLCDSPRSTRMQQRAVCI